MVRELRELMHESVSGPPAGPVHVDEVLRAGRRRVRRRRAIGVTGTAAVVAALAIGSSWGAGIGLGGPDQAAPAGGTAPVGPVLHLDEATRAVEGKDFTVLTTLANQNLDRANGQYYAAVTPDDRVLVQDGPHGTHNTIRWGLLDPATGQTGWLPAPDDGVQPDQLVAVDERWLVWTNGSAAGLGFAVFDRQTQQWTETRLEPAQLGLPAGSMPMFWRGGLGSDDRVYFAVDDMVGDGALVKFALWSVSLDGAADLRREGTVGDFDVDGDQLTWTDYTNRPSSIVHTRDLSTGDESSFDARSGSACNMLGLDRAGDYIVLAQYCGTTSKVRDDRVQVVSAEGDPVVTVQDDGMEGGVDTGDYVLLTGYLEDEAGSYAYDLDSGELLKLADGAAKFGPGVAGDGNLVTWTTPLNHGHGMKYWLAELR